MCGGCWKEYGSPREITPRVLHVAELVKTLYLDETCGGDAHIVTDDWNIEDDHIDWCIEHGTDAIALAVLIEMKKLTIPQRATALAIHGGLIECTADHSGDVHGE